MILLQLLFALHMVYQNRKQESSHTVTSALQPDKQRNYKSIPKQTNELSHRL